MTRRRVRIIGAGLIGASIALRLRELGDEVEIDDLNPQRAELAGDLLGGKGRIRDPEMIIVATPPTSILPVLQEQFALYPNAIFIDVASVKTKLHVELESFPELKKRFVSTHPIAGRETGGVESAQSDLFMGRAWILLAEETPLSNQVSELIRELGATPYRMAPLDHDRLFAAISHLPQLLSIALANSLEPLDDGVELAGQGLRDMTRLAGSNGKLWSEILLANRGEVLTALGSFDRELEFLKSALETDAVDQVIELFDRGNRQRNRLTGKHGARAREYSYLNIVIDDRPGQLAALFNECGAIGANVEDLSLEHSPQQETGLIRLALSENDAANLHEHLISMGWKAHRA